MYAENWGFRERPRARQPLASSSEREGSPHEDAHGYDERCPREDETWESVPKLSASTEATEEGPGRSTSATARGYPGRPIEVRPVRFRIARPCSHARRERVQRLEQVIELLGERLTQLARRRGVDRVLRPATQLRLRFGGLLRRYRRPERLLEGCFLVVHVGWIALRLLGNELFEPARQIP
jgi:hypothetical protein